jgi:DNA-binding phage protein
MAKQKNNHIGSRLDDFLKEEGVLEEFEAAAIKRVLAWQIAEEMKARKLTKVKMAAQMRTSRAQLDRLLDPNEGNVTIETLQRAASALGRKLHVELT